MPWPVNTAKMNSPQSDIQQVSVDTWVGLADLQEESILCCLSVQTCWTHPMQTKTPGFFLLSSFYPLYQNYKDFVLCWCVHIAYVSIRCPVDIIVLNLDFTVGFILHVGWERRRGSLRVVCLLQWMFKAVYLEILSSISSHSLRFNNADVQLRRSNGLKWCQLCLYQRIWSHLILLKQLIKGVNCPLSLQLVSSEMVVRCSQFIRLI